MTLVKYFFVLIIDESSGIEVENLKDFSWMPISLITERVNTLPRTCD